jgi:hypothetical protein
LRREKHAVDPKLHAILEELSDEHRTQPGADALTEPDIELLSRHLPRYTVAEPTVQESRALVDRIRPLLRERIALDVESAAPVAGAGARFADLLREADDARHSAFGTLIRYASAHVASFPRMFWGLSALAVLLCVLASALASVLASPVASPVASGGFAFAATDGAAGGGGLDTNVLIVLIPLIAGLSVSCSFRSIGTPMFELELSFPMTPLQWMLGRLTVVVFYETGLALAASFLLTRGWLNESLPVFVISWLVPLGLYCAGTLALTLRFGTWHGAWIMALLWIAQLPLHKYLGPLYFVSDTHHPHWASSKAAALLLTLLFVADITRQARKRRSWRSPLLRGTKSGTGSVTER